MAARKKTAGKTQEERDRMALGRIETYMDQITQGEITCSSCKEKFPVRELSSSAVQLIRARYDKLRPSLSSVEQRQADPFNGLNRAQLLDLVRKFLSEPSIARELGVKVEKPALVVAQTPKEVDKEPSVYISTSATLG